MQRYEKAICEQIKKITPSGLNPVLQLKIYFLQKNLLKEAFFA